MEKDNLIDLAKNLMTETLFARSYKDILDQYKKNRATHPQEISLSPTFYGISEMALVEALSIRLARLYDVNEKSICLGYLMEQAEEHAEYFPQNGGERLLEIDGKHYRVAIPLMHTLRECEKCYFKEKGEREKAILKHFSDSNISLTHEITIEVSIVELLDMYHKRFASIQTICKKLIAQRNKIYAHNESRGSRTNCW